MPYFYVLRVVREDNPLDRSECQIKFYPILGKNPWLTKPHDAVPIQVEAETDCAAWLLVKTKFPHYHTFLAIQEVISYDRTVAGLITKRLLRGDAGPRPRAQAKNPIRRSLDGGYSGISENQPSRPATDAKKAELAF